MMHYIRIVIGTVLFPYYRWRRFLSLVALLLFCNRVVNDGALYPDCHWRCIA